MLCRYSIYGFESGEIVVTGDAGPQENVRHVFLHSTVFGVFNDLLFPIACDSFRSAGISSATSQIPRTDAQLVSG